MADDTTDTGSGFGGGDTGTAGTAWYLDPKWWQTLANVAQVGIGGYNALKPPTYKQAQLSPEQSALYQRYIAAFDNPATKYNAGLASDLARSEIPRLAPTMPWNRNQTFNMAYMGLTPPTKPDTGANAAYYQNLIKSSMQNQAGNSSPAPPTTPDPTGTLPTGDGSGPTGVAGDPFGHITSPAGSPGDPFADLPSGVNTSDASMLLNHAQSLLSSNPSLMQTLIKGGAGMLGTILGGPFAGLAGSAFGGWLYGKLTGGKQQQQPWGPQDTQDNPLQKFSGELGTPREPWQNPNYQQQAGQYFIGNQNHGLASAPGQMAPEFGGSGQPGFGYGLNYDKFYSGGDSPYMSGPGGVLPWTRHPLV